MLLLDSFKTNTKWQVISSVMALITLTCFCFTLLVFYNNRAGLNEFITQHIASTSLLIKTIEEESSYPLQKRISSISTHRQPQVSAFANRDREKLQKSSSQLFSILKIEFPYIKSFAWITSDNIAFVRSHAPEFFGDDIASFRPDIVAVNKTHQQISGYNAGYMGIQYRIVHPIFYKSKPIGAIQIGLSSQQILHSIEEKLHIPATMAVPDSTFAIVTKPKQQWHHAGGYHFLHSKSDIFTTFKTKVNWQNASSQVNHNGKTYIITKVLDLNNFNNKAIASIVVALDITQKIQSARNHLYLTMLISFLLICSSFIILNKSYTALIQTIVDLNKNLKTSNDQLEGKVEEHSQKLQLIIQAIEQTSETILITDKQGLIQYSNPAFEKLTGYSAAEINGKSTKLFNSGLQSKSFYKHMWTTISEGKIWTGPLVNKRKDGSTYDEFLTISPIFDTDGSIINFVAIKRDISEEVDLERKMHQVMKMESVGRLAGGIAHDFNNILSVINGYCDLCLMKMEEDNPYRQHINTILESGERASKLTQQLLAFSRKQIIQQKIIYLHEAIKDIHNMLARLLGEDIEIKVKIPQDIWPIKADNSQLEQIIINLAVNSRDAMPLGGSLLISAQNISIKYKTEKEDKTLAAGDYIRIEFSDTGQGMTNEVSEQIFEPFFTTKEQGKGTGLGLATVYGIVKQNNGRINVCSEPNIGTTFSIYLPAESGHSKTSTPTKSTPKTSAIKGGDETILLVEDEAGVRSLCEEILTDIGYTVIGAQDGNQALEVEKNYTGHIDLLLTDVVMPHMNGSELAPLIKKKRPDITILFMSGYTEDSIAQHGILEEGINFINKPISPAQLTQQVRLILDGK